MMTTESLGIWHQAELTRVIVHEGICEQMDASRDVKINVHQRSACVQVRIMIASIYNRACVLDKSIVPSWFFNSKSDPACVDRQLRLINTFTKTR